MGLTAYEWKRREVFQQLSAELWEAGTKIEPWVLERVFDKAELMLQKLLGPNKLERQGLGQ
jgi:hypothetical protein